MEQEIKKLNKNVDKLAKVVEMLAQSQIEAKKNEKTIIEKLDKMIELEEKNKNILRSMLFRNNANQKGRVYITCTHCKSPVSARVSIDNFEKIYCYNCEKYFVSP